MRNNKTYKEYKPASLNYSETVPYFESKSWILLILRRRESEIKRIAKKKTHKYKNSIRKKYKANAKPCQAEFLNT